MEKNQRKLASAIHEVTYRSIPLSARLRKVMECLIGDDEVKIVSGQPGPRGDGMTSGEVFFLTESFVGLLEATEQLESDNFAANGSRNEGPVSIRLFPRKDLVGLEFELVKRPLFGPRNEREELRDYALTLTFSGNRTLGLEKEMLPLEPEDSEKLLQELRNDLL